MKFKWVLFAAFGLGFVATPRASEADTGKVNLTGDVHWTAVSGDTGVFDHLIGNTNDVQAAYSIEWWEDSDDPCKFAVHTRHLNIPTNIMAPDWTICSGSPGNMKWVERRGPNEYISSVQVCTNDPAEAVKAKVKGIRLWGKTVDLNAATLGPENGPEEVTHTNCKTWKSKVSCPAGEIASKIKVHFEKYTTAWGYASNGWVKGISLGCRKIVKA